MANRLYVRLRPHNPRGRSPAVHRRYTFKSFRFDVDHPQWYAVTEDLGEELEELVNAYDAPIFEVRTREDLLQLKKRRERDPAAADVVPDDAFRRRADKKTRRGRRTPSLSANETAHPADAAFDTAPAAAAAEPNLPPELAAEAYEPEVEDLSYDGGDDFVEEPVIGDDIDFGEPEPTPEPAPEPAPAPKRTRAKRQSKKKTSKKTSTDSKPKTRRRRSAEA